MLQLCPYHKHSCSCRITSTSCSALPSCVSSMLCRHDKISAALIRCGTTDCSITGCMIAMEGCIFPGSPSIRLPVFTELFTDGASFTVSIYTLSSSDEKSENTVRIAGGGDAAGRHARACSMRVMRPGIQMDHNEEEASSPGVHSGGYTRFSPSFSNESEGTKRRRQ